jgi:hypothetical protein
MAKKTGSAQSGAAALRSKAAGFRPFLRDCLNLYCSVMGEAAF